MKKIITSETELDEVRSKFLHSGRSIVRYENVEKYINDVFYGDSKITKGFLADFNNIVEGIVLDDIIELLDRGDVDSVISQSLRNSADVIFALKKNDKNGGCSANDRFSKRCKEYQVLEVCRMMTLAYSNGYSETETKSIFDEFLGCKPEHLCFINEMARKYTEINIDNVKEFSDAVGRHHEISEDYYDVLYDKLEMRFIESGVMESKPIYHPQNSLTNIEKALEKIQKNTLIDNGYFSIKCTTLAYRDELNDIGIDIRLPFIFRAPSIEGPSVPRVSYDLYKKIADIHRTHVDNIVKYGGVIEAYLPPLLSILLGRCQTKDDIPLVLEEMRSEFELLRYSVRNFFSMKGEALPSGAHPSDTRI